MPAAIGLLTFISRIVVGATGPTDWDSVQFASGANIFDVTRGSPHPPGYFLYAMGGRFLHVVFGMGVIHALVLISAVTSAAAVAAGYLAGRAIGGTWLGLALAAFLFTSPFMWFNGAVVQVFNFDALACSLFILLALEARRNSLHGVAAVLALTILAGFRQSVGFFYLPVTLVAVFRSTRSLRRWSQVAACAIGGLVVWVVPLALIQPGGLTAWLRASHLETQGQLRTTSILDHGPVAHTIILTMLGETFVALAPLAFVTVVAIGGLALRRLRRSRSPDDFSASWLSHQERATVRPIGRLGVVVLAIVPALLSDIFITFGTGGYALAFLPGAAILLLLPAARLIGSEPYAPLSVGRLARPTGILVTAAVLGVCVLGTQRFVFGQGVLPGRYVRVYSGAWFLDPRYGAPEYQTRYTITSQDAEDNAFLRLSSIVNRRHDVILMTYPDLDQYRQVGWAMPSIPVGVTTGPSMLYWEKDGLLYYPKSSVAYVPAGGRLFVLVRAIQPPLANLIQSRDASVVGQIGGFSVVRMDPGVNFGALQIKTGPPRLGLNLVSYG